MSDQRHHQQREGECPLWKKGMGYLLRFVGVGLLLSLVIVTAHGQDLPVDSVKNDTLQTDSTAAPQDTTRLYLPSLPPPGAVHLVPDLVDHGLTKYEIPDRIHYTLFDPLRSTSDGYVLSGSVPGEIGGIIYAGAPPEKIAYLFNGRPLSGPHGSGYDPGFYPLEFSEVAEYVEGGEGMVYGGADALSSVNILQPQFDVEGSYLRLVFGQAAAATSRAEGIFARNLSRRTNLAVGFRRLVSDGIYSNQDVDGFNAYGSLFHRYNAALSASLTGMVSDFDRGANGGLLPESSFGLSTAKVHNDTLTEASLRHDLTLTLRWVPGLGGRNVSDTLDAEGLTRFDGNIYYSHAKRALLIGDREALIDGETVGDQGDVLGLNGRIVSWLGKIGIQGVVRGELENGRSGNLHAGALFSVPLTSLLSVGGGGAVTGREGDMVSGIFGEVRVHPAEKFGLRGTWRLLSGDEPDDGGATQVLTGEGTRWLAEVEGEWKGEDVDTRFTGWLRRGIRNGSQEEYSISGVTFSGFVPISFLRLRWHLSGTLAPEGDERFPLIGTRGDIFLPLHLLNGALDLDLGTQVAWQSTFSGIEHNPVTGDWLYPGADVLTNKRQQWALINLFASARIGSAYLNLTLFNLLDAEYRTVNRYPIWGRSLQFGITWTMID